MKYCILIAAPVLLCMLSACYHKDKESISNAALCSMGFNPNLHPIDADSVFVTAPTAFTPNGDGRNDIYRIITKNVDSSLSYTIADSSDATVFTYPNSTGTNYWDGTVNGIQAPAGAYTATVRFKTGSAAATETCSQILLIRPNAAGCLESHGQALRISFEDQLDVTTGQISFATGETLCN